MTFSKTKHVINNELINFKLVEYTDLKHVKNDMFVINIKQTLNNEIAKILILLIVNDLRKNDFFIDYNQFKKSFLANYFRKSFILKKDFNYEISFNIKFHNFIFNNNFEIAEIVK